MKTTQQLKMTISDIAVEFITENAVLLCWPENIDEAQHHHILAVQREINNRLGQKLIDSVASYNSLIVYYHFASLTVEHLFFVLSEVISETSTSPQNDQAANNNAKASVVEIPVLYNEVAGWDLAKVASATKLSCNDVINIHSQSEYRAYALGFTPGFCYLASLDESLILPRRQKPRLRVPKGAVAIAGSQTAVYPNESPGGWHIIGQTPFSMYHLTACFSPTISVGDTVRFRAIDEDEFERLGGQVQQESR
ncbi:5-oxoprolinase subunit PxpB [Thalassotalea fusca]